MLLALNNLFPLISVQPLPNRILEGERMEDVAVIVCHVCLVAHNNLVTFQGAECPHLICRTCFDQVTECPYCKASKGDGPGKMINVSSLVILRKEDVESNFGVTQEMLDAAAQVTRRPGDESEYEFFQRRNQEAIREALIEDGQNPDVEILSQHSNNTTFTTESLPSSPAAPSFSPLSTPPASPRPSHRGRGTARGNARSLARGTARSTARGTARPRGRGRGGLSQPVASQDRSRSASRLNRSLGPDEIRRIIEASSESE